jgi:hypothetical protein
MSNKATARVSTTPKTVSTTIPRSVLLGLARTLFGFSDSGLVNYRDFSGRIFRVKISKGSVYRIIDKKFFATDMTQIHQYLDTNPPLGKIYSNEDYVIMRQDAMHGPATRKSVALFY